MLYAVRVRLYPNAAQREFFCADVWLLSLGV